MKNILRNVENIAGNEENAGYQHFLLFPQCFQRASFLGSLILKIVWYFLLQEFSLSLQYFLLQEVSLSLQCFQKPSFIES